MFQIMYFLIGTIKFHQFVLFHNVACTQIKRDREKCQSCLTKIEPPFFYQVIKTKKTYDIFYHI